MEVLAEPTEQKEASLTGTPVASPTEPQLCAEGAIPEAAFLFSFHSE